MEVFGYSSVGAQVKTEEAKKLNSQKKENTKSEAYPCPPSILLNRNRNSCTIRDMLLTLLHQTRNGRKSGDHFTEQTLNLRKNEAN